MALGDAGEIPVIFITFTLCLVLLFGAVHTAFVYNGQAVVDAAAQDAFSAVQVKGGTREDGRRAAEETLSYAPFLTSHEIKIYSNDKFIQVYVSAEINTTFVDLQKTVWARAGGSQERFYNEEERDG